MKSFIKIVDVLVELLFYVIMFTFIVFVDKPSNHQVLTTVAVGWIYLSYKFDKMNNNKTN